MMTFNELKDDAQGILLTVFGIDYPAIFTNGRIDKDTVPDGYYCYHLREDDNGGALFCGIANTVIVNHGGSVITKTPIDFSGHDSAYDSDFDYSFDDITLDEFSELNLT